METILRPAIRSGMGQWNYYVSSLTYEQVAKYVKMPDEIYQSKKLSDMLQRELTSNAKSIYEYLNTEKERFFNSLVLAVYGGAPKWHEGVFEMNDIEFANIGVLELTGEERIFPVDGQHRVSAIKTLVAKHEANSIEEVPVIFISHEDNEDGIKRTRKLFTTLNRYAKPVKKSEIIALDEDDVTAIVTRRLVEDNGLFSGDRIAFLKGESLSDKQAFTTIITLGKCNELLLKRYIDEKGIKVSFSKFIRYRPSDEIIEDYYKYVLDFWKDLIMHTAVKNYMEGDADAASFRTQDGGDLLFRPAGIKACVEAVTDIQLHTGDSYKKILTKFSKIDFELSSAPWQGVLWNNGKMIMNNKNLVKQFFIFNYDAKMTDKKGKIVVDKEKMIDEYRALIGSEEDDNVLLDKIIQKKIS